MKRLALPLFLLAACASAPEAQPQRPAPGPYAIAPGIDNIAQGEQPVVGPLRANESLSGRLVREGQSVRYPLPTEPGQLSLIDCEAWGYARGTESQGELRVLDRNGKPVAQVHLAGRTLHQATLPFVAGDRGPYQVELLATEAFFRYVLVRHGSYAQYDSEQANELGQRSEVQGWLAEQNEPVNYRVQGRPGQRIVVHVEPTHERGREYQRRWWFRRPLAAARLLAPGTPATQVHALRRGEKPFPKFVVGLAGQTLEQAAHSQVFVVPDNGFLHFWVAQQGNPEAGLFDLHMQRDLNWRQVQLRVANREDHPLSKTQATFLLEPWMARITDATTDSSGQCAALVPDGSYSVVLTRSSTKHNRVIRLRSDQDDLFLVW